jgi:hypothetical protein
MHILIHQAVFFLSQHVLSRPIVEKWLSKLLLRVSCIQQGELLLPLEGIIRAKAVQERLLLLLVALKV